MAATRWEWDGKSNGFLAVLSLRRARPAAVRVDGLWSGLSCRALAAAALSGGVYLEASSVPLAHGTTAGSYRR
jgi:hypothetical protein